MFRGNQRTQISPSGCRDGQLDGQFDARFLRPIHPTEMRATVSLLRAMLFGVDFVRPVQSLIPGAQGRVLDVLARTTAELNLGTVARLAGISPAQASRVLPRLVALGVVERRDVPPSSQYRLVRENLMAQAVVDLVDVRERTTDRLRVLAGAIRPAPASLVLFGSLARGEADADSDIDVLVVRRADVDGDGERWNHTLGDWLVEARRATGNAVNHLEVSAAEVPARLRSRKPLWRDVQRDGVVLLGKPLEQLAEPGRHTNGGESGHERVHQFLDSRTGTAT